MENTLSLNRTDLALLQALNNGAANKLIAHMMCRSEYTVRNQLSNLYKKINATNRTHAVLWYREYVERKKQYTEGIDRRKNSVPDRRKVARTFSAEHPQA